MAIFRISVERRYSDLDTLNHVNNVVYAEYLQEARVRLLTEVGHVRGETFAQVLARQEIDFVKPLLLRREPISVEVWVESLGRSSYTTGYRVLDDDGSVAARARAVMVYFDAATGSSAPLPEDLRERLEQVKEVP
jgi:acyl-CoA thioester hydrolase